LSTAGERQNHAEDVRAMRAALPVVLGYVTLVY
jgi:hypothetical protein